MQIVEENLRIMQSEIKLKDGSGENSEPRLIA
jgi:hypothetical protein